jgi:hypothetical protein
VTDIYALVDPRSGEIRYIGKANDPRARLAQHIRDSRHRDTPVYRWVRKLLDSGLLPTMSILEVDCSDWRKSERRLIADARSRGLRLLNVADGGDEPKCPAGVRESNGRMAAARKSEPWFYCVQAMGKAQSEARRAGKHDRATYFSETAKILRQMAPTARAAFNSRWIERGHYVPQ